MQQKDEILFFTYLIDAEISDELVAQAEYTVYEQRIIYLLRHRVDPMSLLFIVMFNQYVYLGE